MTFLMGKGTVCPTFVVGLTFRVPYVLESKADAVPHDFE